MSALAVDIFAEARDRANELIELADWDQLDEIREYDETRENCRARLKRLAQTDAFLVLALMGA